MGNAVMHMGGGPRSGSLDSQLRSDSLDSQLLEDAGIEDMLAEDFEFLQQHMPTPPGHQRPSKLTHVEVIALIRTALNNGAAMYATGDALGCAELYKRCAMQLLAMDLSLAQAERLRAALGSSAMQSHPERAWALQAALQSVAQLADEPMGRGSPGTAHMPSMQRPGEAQHMALRTQLGY